jgi:hypothetical protein
MPRRLHSRFAEGELKLRFLGDRYRARVCEPYPWTAKQLPYFLVRRCYLEPWRPAEPADHIREALDESHRRPVVQVWRDHLDAHR